MSVAECIFSLGDPLQAKENPSGSDPVLIDAMLDETRVALSKYNDFFELMIKVYKLDERFYALDLFNRSYRHSFIAFAYLYYVHRVNDDNKGVWDKYTDSPENKDLIVRLATKRQELYDLLIPTQEEAKKKFESRVVAKEKARLQEFLDEAINELQTKTATAIEIVKTDLDIALRDINERNDNLIDANLSDKIVVSGSLRPDTMLRRINNFKTEIREVSARYSISRLEEAEKSIQIVSTPNIKVLTEDGNKAIQDKTAAEAYVIIAAEKNRMITLIKHTAELAAKAAVSELEQLAPLKKEDISALELRLSIEDVASGNSKELYSMMKQDSSIVKAECPMTEQKENWGELLMTIRRDAVSSNKSSMDTVVRIIKVLVYPEAHGVSTSKALYDVQQLIKDLKSQGRDDLWKPLEAAVNERRIVNVASAKSSDVASKEEVRVPIQATSNAKPPVDVADSVPHNGHASSKVVDPTQKVSTESVNNHHLSKAQSKVPSSVQNPASSKANNDFWAEWE